MLWLGLLLKQCYEPHTINS